MKKKNKGWVPIADAMVVFDRLIAIYGTKAKVAKALGIHKQGFLNPNKKYIQRRIFNKGRKLLAEHEKETLPSSAGGLPLEVVDAKALSVVLRAWCVKFLAERPPQYGDYTGPTKVLAHRTGKTERNVSNYINGTSPSPWVGVSVADALLLAIDEDGALRDGRIEVFPNPQLSMEAWLERMSRRGCV